MEMPRLPDGVRFGVGAYVFGDFVPERDLPLIAAAGFPGIEPYRGLTMAYLNRPHDLKAMLDHHGIAMVTCSNGGPGQSCDFISPDARQQTIDDHVTFARDWLTVFDCRHFKINMGSRSPHATTEDELGRIAATINEIGRQTAQFGIRIAPHPHIWGPVERPEEIRRLLELTDPAVVSLTLDTAHVNLGGGDPMAFVTEHYDRICAIHWKDTKAAYRGYTGPTPTQAMHRDEILYKDLGAGGVDLPAFWQALQERGYAYWITLDLDPPRAAEGEGSVAEKIAANKRYLTETLGITRL